MFLRTSIIGILLTASAFVGGVLAVWVLDGARVHAQDNVVRSQRFDAVDTEGKVGARFGVAPDGKPFLALLDKAGKPRLSGSVAPNGAAAITIAGRDERKRAEIGIGPDDAPYVSLADKTGKATIALTVDAQGSPGLTVTDKDGAPVAVLAIGADGKAALTFPEKPAPAAPQSPKK